MGIFHLPKDSGNFPGKCLSVKDVFHLTHTSHSSQAPFTIRYVSCQNTKWRPQLLLLNKMLDFSLEEESLVYSDDDDIPILAAVATYMRRPLHRNKDFYENILLAYTIDEFKSHFRMT